MTLDRPSKCCPTGQTHLLPPRRANSVRLAFFNSLSLFVCLGSGELEEAFEPFHPRKPYFTLLLKRPRTSDVSISKVLWGQCGLMNICTFLTVSHFIEEN
ncbi:unnamed protein product [Rangifer tarandus platyrhynchus]|uniref:Uncharacterized protein n=2 Tax=Rangifer tarandus platyrhynchus TaxID=3082113 RepID=A0ABN8ZLL6_RANTA|nr:unnamed protein product [Rangifer tarandus platyrhynchus]